MSKRTSKTIAAGSATRGSRWTGYAKPNKKAVSLAELNDQLKNNIHHDYRANERGLQV